MGNDLHSNSTRELKGWGWEGDRISLESTESWLPSAQNNLNTTETHLGVTCSESQQFTPLKPPEKYHIPGVGLIVSYLVKPVSISSIGQSS